MSADNKENPAPLAGGNRADRQETDTAISHKKPRRSTTIFSLSDLGAALERVNVDAQSDVLSDDIAGALDGDGERP